MTRARSCRSCRYSGVGLSVRVQWLLELHARAQALAPAQKVTMTTTGSTQTTAVVPIIEALFSPDDKTALAGSWPPTAG